MKVGEGYLRILGHGYGSPRMLGMKDLPKSIQIDVQHEKRRSFLHTVVKYSILQYERTSIYIFFFEHEAWLEVECFFGGVYVLEK